MSTADQADGEWVKEDLSVIKLSPEELVIEPTSDVPADNHLAADHDAIEGQTVCVVACSNGHLTSEEPANQAKKPRRNGDQWDLNLIPMEILKLPQWVSWKFAERGGKPTKIPVRSYSFTSRNGRNKGELVRPTAGTDDPTTWFFSPTA